MNAEVSKLRDDLHAALSKQRLNRSDVQPIAEWLDALQARERRDKGAPNFRDYLRDDFVATLESQGIRSGRICEIGGPYNSFAKDLPQYEFEFPSLYPDTRHEGVIVADATQCDYVASERYDAIFSVSVFEHISKPWLAAEQLNRLLKPGGVSYHAAPFSYFYHGAPADFWRYTPDAMRLLFSELEPLKAEFFGRNRRRDNRGSPSNSVDRDGGEAFAVDAFDGWRENWYTIYAGLKNAAHLEQRLSDAAKQVVVNLMKMRTIDGEDEESAARAVRSVLDGYVVTRDQELHRADRTNIPFTEAQILELYRNRGRNGIRPSYNRFVMAKSVGW